jgi:YggT family protein
MAQTIATILYALQLLVLVDALLSWMMGPEQFPRSLTTRITEPLYAPVRAILSPEKLGGFDVSPIVMLLLLRAMQQMLASRL